MEMRRQTLVLSMKKVKKREITQHELELRHLRLSQVLELVAVGERTWLRWVSAGMAPRPVRLGERAVGWRLSSIKKFLDSRPTVGSAK